MRDSFEEKHGQKTQLLANRSLVSNSEEFVTWKFLSTSFLARNDRKRMA